MGICVYKDTDKATANSPQRLAMNSLPHPNDGRTYSGKLSLNIFRKCKVARSGYPLPFREV
jgi:hypothetical protein